MLWSTVSWFWQNFDIRHQTYQGDCFITYLVFDDWQKFGRVVSLKCTVVTFSPHIIQCIVFLAIWNLLFLLLRGVTIDTQTETLCNYSWIFKVQVVFMYSSCILICSNLQWYRMKYLYLTVPEKIVHVCRNHCIPHHLIVIEVR